MPETLSGVPEGSGPGPKEPFDLIDKVRREPVPAMLVVGFLVASALVTLGLQLLGAHSDASRDKLEGVEARYRAQLEVCAARNTRYENDFGDLRTSIEGCRKENEKLVSLQGKSGTEREQALAGTIEQLNSQLEIARDRHKLLTQQNEQLRLRTTQLALPEPRAGDAHREISALQQRINTLENQLAQTQVQPQTTHTVQFEVLTASGVSVKGDESKDFITICFSSMKAGAGDPGSVISSSVAEFTFWAAQANPSQPYAFTKTVRDLSFLDARFIRVFNQGGDGWAGEWISMTVDGKEVLTRQPLYPRLGPDPVGGIEKFTPGEWTKKAYWEADFQQVRRR